MFRGDLLRDGHPAGATLTADQAAHLKLAWTRQLDGAINGSPVVLGSRVIALSDHGEIGAWDIRSGASLWTHTGLGSFAGTAAIAGGTVVAATLTGHVLAFNLETGRAGWDWTAPGVQPAIWSSPAVFGQTVVVGIASQYGDKPLEAGRVAALDVATGQQKWIFCVLIGCAPGAGVWSSAAIDGAGRGIVGVGNPDDGLLAFDAATGRVLWQTSLHPDADRDLDVGATPVIFTAGGREEVAVGSNAGIFALLDAANGNVIWSRLLVAGSAVHGLIASPAYDGQSLYVGSASPPTGMIALDPKTGSIQWEVDTPLPVYSAPVVGALVLLFGTGDALGDAKGGALTALSTTDGAVVWSYATKDAVLGGPAMAGNHVIAGTAGGSLLAFAP